MATLTASKGELIAWKSGIEPDLALSLPPTQNYNRVRWFSYMCTNSGYFYVQLSNAVSGRAYIGFYRYSISEKKWVAISEYKNQNATLVFAINMGIESNSLYEGIDSIHFCCVATNGNASKQPPTIKSYVGNYCTMSKTQYDSYLKHRKIYLKQPIQDCVYYSYNDGIMDTTIDPSSFAPSPFNSSWGKVGLDKGRKIMASDAKNLITYQQ